MKLPLLAALLLLPCVALAQDATNSTDNPSGPTCSTDGKHKHKHHFTPEQELAFLTKKLDLSTSQQSQIGPILTSAADKRKTIHEDTTLTKEQKHDQMKALHEDTTSQITALLDQDQATTFAALQEKHHKK